jgi:hypothetical protein
VTKLGSHRAGTNTTIAIVATDARLTKPAAKRMAIAAHDGLARALVPSHTPMDGDLVFAAATGASEGLAAFLPEPLEGWTREVTDDPGQGLGFMGGGSAAEATYSGPGGSFTIMMVADNPMVGAMAGMLGNPALMSTMGRIARIGGESFLDAEGELSALIGGRVLIQASGADVETMSAHLEQIDFGALEDFGG